MALSGSTNLNYTAENLVKLSLYMIGGLVRGEEADPDDIQEGIDRLNIMFKAFKGKGLKLHLRKTVSLTPVAAQFSYTIGPSGANITAARPEEILGVYLRDISDKTNTPLTMLTYEEYYALQSRESTDGNPTQFLYEPTRTDGTLKFFPIPDSTTVTDKTLEIYYRDVIDDIDAFTDDIEIPPEWYEAIIGGLAWRLSFKAGLNRGEKRDLKSFANEALFDAMGADVESSVYFEPDFD